MSHNLLCNNLNAENELGNDQCTPYVVLRTCENILYTESFHFLCLQNFLNFSLKRLTNSQVKIRLLSHSYIQPNIDAIFGINSKAKSRAIGVPQVSQRQ